MFSVVSLTLLKFQTAPSVTAIGNLGGGSVTEGSVSKLQIPWHGLKETPTCFQLLSWHTRVSTFSGRDVEMAKLQKWADSDDAISVQFVIGEGGVGKSRLGAELAQSLKDCGWAAGFVDLRNESAFEMNKAGTLLIIDYPEEHGKPVEELLADLAKLSHDKVDRFRVLFLTRQEMSVWDGVVSRAKAEDIIETVPVQIGPLKPVSAHELYSSTLEVAGKELDFDPPPLSEVALHDWMEQSPENKRALFIMAAAVHSVLHPDEEIVKYSGAEIMNVLAERELVRLTKASIEIGATEFALARLLAMGAIAGRMHITRLEELVAQEELKLGFPSVEKENLEDILQTTGVLNDRAVHAPTPDILASAFTVNVLSRKPETAPEIIWAALEQDIEGGFERISRLAFDAEFVLCILEHRISEWAALSVNGNVERCMRIEGVIEEEHLPLTLIGTAVAAYKTLLATEVKDEQRAQLYNNLSNSLSNAGDYEGVLEAVGEAVELYRKLNEANPLHFAPKLATSLNNLTSILSKTGDNGGALAAIEEAVEIRRKLNEANSERFAPDLAMSLMNLSNILSDTGDYDGALEAIRESYELYRKLNDANPTRFTPNFAMSLNNLSNRLFEARDNDGALAAIKEAVEIRRKLNEANPERFAPDFAMSLSNQSLMLSTVGDKDGALEAVGEAVELCRKLNKANPARFAPDLARSLGAYGSILRNDGKINEAAEAFKEGAELVAPFAKQLPGGSVEVLFNDLSTHYEETIKIIDDEK